MNEKSVFWKLLLFASCLAACVSLLTTGVGLARYLPVLLAWPLALAVQVGLFGLASFTAEQRTKEIGIRKLLGASVSGLVLMFSNGFVKLVGIAALIAWPVSYFALDMWVQAFAYQTSIGIVPLLVAGLVALAIAWLTVSYQSIKTALADPVESLRYE